jgi:hypothetical protein
MKISRRQLRRLIENKLKEQKATPTVIYGDENTSITVPANSEAIFKIDPNDPNTFGVSLEVITGDHTKISLKVPGVKVGVTRDNGNTIMKQLYHDQKYNDNDGLQSCIIKNNGIKDATVEVMVYSGY